MIFNIVIASILVSCLGKTSTALSPESYQREVAPFPYILRTTNSHYYENNFKKKSSGYWHKKNYQARSQRYGKIQYAPLEIRSVGGMNMDVIYSKTTEVDTDYRRITTSKNNLQPQMYKHYNANSKENQSNKNVYTNVKKNDRGVEAHVVLPEKIVLYVSTQAPDTEYHSQQRPLKHIMQGLGALENAKIQPVLNSFYKVSQKHSDTAHNQHIARGHIKAREIGHQNRIYLNNRKQKFVPDIDVLLEQKTFLYPIRNNIL